MKQCKNVVSNVNIRHLQQVYKSKSKSLHLFLNPPSNLSEVNMEGDNAVNADNSATTCVNNMSQAGVLTPQNIKGTGDFKSTTSMSLSMQDDTTQKGVNASSEVMK